MTHGLATFQAKELIDRARSANALIEATLDEGKEASADVLIEAVRISLENQIVIAETLELIKREFDKFEEGLDKIL